MYRNNYFTTINFIDIKNYYDEMYNQYEIENNNFEDKLKKENGVLGISTSMILMSRARHKEQEINERNKKPENLKLNSLSALLMDGDNNGFYKTNGYKEMQWQAQLK